MITNQTPKVSQEAKHTPGPWKLLSPDQVRGHEGEWICSCEGGHHRQSEDADNAQRIVQCVNCHDELLEALEVLLLAYETSKEGASVRFGAEIKARAAIAKAQGIAGK